MRKLMIAALLAGQVAAAQPAAAADFAEARQDQAGAFAGFRLRLPLDGARRERQIRAGFTVAPTLQSRAIGGETRTRIGEGLELGITGRQPVRLLIAGRDSRRLGAAEDGNGRHRGPSTLGWIAIGVGAAVVIVVGAAVLCASDHDCLPSE